MMDEEETEYDEHIWTSPINAIPLLLYSNINQWLRQGKQGKANIY